MRDWIAVKYSDGGGGAFELAGPMDWQRRTGWIASLNAVEIGIYPTRQLAAGAIEQARIVPTPEPESRRQWRDMCARHRQQGGLGLLFWDQDAMDVAALSTERGE